MTDQEKQEPLSILKDPGLLDIILDHLHRCGVVGEDTNLLVAWLVSLSRKLERPLGLCIRSRNAAGKSYLLQAVAAFIPEEDKLEFCTLTPQALARIQESELEHKALFITEASSQLLDQSRSMEAPVALFFGSASNLTDEEILTHLLVLNMDESPEQTRRIHEAQKHAHTLEGIIEARECPRVICCQQNV